MTNEDAIRRAQVVAIDRGWPWEGPFLVEARRAHVLFGAKHLVVRSNASMRGRNVLVRIDDATGAIITAHFVQR